MERTHSNHMRWQEKVTTNAALQKVERQPKTDLEEDAIYAEGPITRVSVPVWEARKVGK